MEYAEKEGPILTIPEEGTVTGQIEIRGVSTETGGTDAATR